MHLNTTCSSPLPSEDFNVKIWGRTWYQERLQHPAELLIVANEPLQAGQWIYIGAIAASPYPGASTTTQWGLCLIDEYLHEGTAAWLNAALPIIKKRQKRDTEEALGSLMNMWLYRRDLVRARQGKTPLFFESQWAPLGHSSQNLFNHLPRLLRAPVWNLSQLEDWYRSWRRLGCNPLDPGELCPPQAQAGRVCKLTLPPSWMSYDELRTFFAKRDVARAAASTGVHYRVGAPSDIDSQDSSNTNMGEKTSEDEETAVGFFYSSDYRSVSLQGKTFDLRPNEAHVIEYLHAVNELVHYGDEFWLVSDVRLLEPPNHVE